MTNRIKPNLNDCYSEILFKFRYDIEENISNHKGRDTFNGVWVKLLSKINNSSHTNIRFLVIDKLWENDIIES